MALGPGAVGRSATGHTSDVSGFQCVVDTSTCEMSASSMQASLDSDVISFNAAMSACGRGGNKRMF